MPPRVGKEMELWLEEEEGEEAAVRGRERSPGRRKTPGNFLSGKLISRMQRQQEMGREKVFS